MKKKGIVVYCIILFMILFMNTQVLLFTYVPTLSMDPTIEAYDIVMNTRIFKHVNRGDIVVFERDGKQYIKRVIGLPGETLEIIDQKIYIDGERIEEVYIKEPMITDNMEVKIPKGEYFVMGDNRNNSKDSRFYGTINKIKAKTLVIF